MILHGAERHDGSKWATLGRPEGGFYGLSNGREQRGSLVGGDVTVEARAGKRGLVLLPAALCWLRSRADGAHRRLFGGQLRRSRLRELGH